MEARVSEARATAERRVREAQAEVVRTAFDRTEVPAGESGPGGWLWVSKSGQVPAVIPGVEAAPGA